MIAFVIRLSAIGDTVIAARSVRRLMMSGIEPVFVTFESTFDIAAAVPELKYIAIIKSDGSLHFFERRKAGSEASSFSETDIRVVLSELLTRQQQIPVVDLQNTGRSKRALKSLRAAFGKGISFRLFTVQKRTLFRFFLVFLAWFAFRQRQRGTSFDVREVRSIHDLQDEIISNIIQWSHLPVVKDSPRPYLVAPERASESVFQKIGTEQFVILFPGASAFLKAWPKEHYRKLIKRVLETTQLKIVICGGPDEVEVGQFLAFDEPSRVVNLVAQTRLADILTLVEKSQYVVTGDSFGAHIADAFEKPSTVIFGATSPKFGFVPQSKVTTVRYENLNCSPCTRHGKGRCKFANLRCLTSILPEVVFDDIKRSGT